MKCANCGSTDHLTKDCTEASKELTDNSGGDKEARGKGTKAAADADPKDYAYTPDLKDPSSWKLKLGASKADFSGIPKEELPSVKARLRADWKKNNPGKEVPEIYKSATTPAQLLEKASNVAKTFLGKGA